MKKDEILSLARESGAMFDHMNWLQRDLEPVFLRFAALVAEKEREECAMLCDDLYRAWGKGMDENLKCPDPIDCADAIRARGQK
jgi:hypothetical protein